MRALRWLSLPLLALVAAAPAFGEGASAWHDSLDKGVLAARASGKPVLVVTLWKSGV